MATRWPRTSVNCAGSRVDVVAHGLPGDDIAFSLAVEAGLAQDARQRLAGALRVIWISPISDMAKRGSCSCRVQGFPEGREYPLLIGFLLHVDEVDDDDAADVAQTTW